jgi:hypothetical protein
MKAEINLKSGLMHLLPEKPVEGKFLQFLFEKNISFSRSSMCMVGNSVKALHFRINNGEKK